MKRNKILLEFAHGQVVKEKVEGDEVYLAEVWNSNETPWKIRLSENDLLVLTESILAVRKKHPVEYPDGL